MSDHTVRVADERLEAGRDLVAEAKDILQSGGGQRAEAPLREALAKFRSAMNWYEAAGIDSQFEEAHRGLHAAGRLVREQFGCLLGQEGDNYFITCPAALAHVRVGLSLGAIAHRIECSICDQEISDCLHIKGREYDGNVCGHRLMNLEPHEVSLVAYPAQPDCRIVKQSVGLEDLLEELGTEFQVGMPVSCDRCLIPCAGVSRPFG